MKTTEPTPTPLDQLQQRAHRLRLYGLLHLWHEVDPAIRERLCEAQEEQLQLRSLPQRTAYARIGNFKSMAVFDWQWPTYIDRRQVERAMTLDFVAEHANLVLVGPNGVGKSLIAQNVAHQALLHGLTVRFVKASDMLADLAAQTTTLDRKRRLRAYIAPALLVIDEVGYTEYDNRATDLLFTVFDARNQHRSTVLTTNLTFEQWPSVFPNAACVVTLVDRLNHYIDTITIEGESFRLKESKERVARIAAAAAASPKRR